jgi:biofilm PGA synthesis N-glycosyltransferase PgaC
MKWRNRRMWPLAFEATGSLAWVVGLALAFLATTIDVLVGTQLPILGFGIAWGIAIAVVALMQLSFALSIERRYDRRAGLAFILGPLYPMGYWAISAAAALRTEVPAVISGPSEECVIWNIERERIDTKATS